jgi:predicted MPP superfamily phosphohydrolase
LTLSRRQFLIGSASAAALTALPAAWYGAVFEPQDIELVKRSILLRGLSSKLDGSTLVQVSDFHIVRTGEVHTKMIQLIQELQPGTLVVTGDFVNDKSAVGEAADLISNIKAPNGIWAVPGNWDHTAEAVDDLRSQLEAAGGHLLINEAAALDKSLWLVGVDDPASDHDDLDGAVKDVPDGASRILLAHSPDISRSLAQHHFDLVMCGHTHGGQVNLPLLNGAWLKQGPTSVYVQGMYSVHGSPLYVNRGIGTTSLPIRIACRPEITQWTLHAA